MREARRIFQLMTELSELTDEDRSVWLSNAKAQYRREATLAAELKTIYEDALLSANGGGKRAYFISIRPPPSVQIDTFLRTIHRLMTRKCFQSWTLSYEQKGEAELTLGVGFHVHIVAEMTQNNKAQVIRDVASTLKEIVPAHAIDVSVTKNPDNIIKKYLTEYASNDGHKAVTMTWDALWRKRVGLKALYTNEDLPLCVVTSPVSDTHEY